MEANELMIGDWVMYNPNVFSEDEHETAKQWILTRIYSGEDIDLAMEGFYAPIPLTPEILERNGLKLSSTGSHFNEDKDYLLEISFYENEIFWTINLNEYDILKLKYVHELQHAIKLCRIDKEIVL